MKVDCWFNKMFFFISISRSHFSVFNTFSKGEFSHEISEVGLILGQDVSVEFTCSTCVCVVPLGSSGSPGSSHSPETFKLGIRRLIGD